MSQKCLRNFAGPTGSCRGPIAIDRMATNLACEVQRVGASRLRRKSGGHNSLTDV